MFKRILVPLDGSERAERAIPVAARITSAFRGSLLFVRVILPPTDWGSRSFALQSTAPEEELAQGAKYLSDVVLRYTADLAGSKIATEVISGVTSSTIFSEAHTEQADLIVMCSHGETGLKRWLLGSVAQQAVRRSPVPVLVLNEHGMVSLPAADQSLRVLVPVDGFPLSETALEPAARLIAALAAPSQGALHILYVVHLSTFDQRFISQAHGTSIEAEVRTQATQEAQVYLHSLRAYLHQGPLATLPLTITSSVVVNTDVAGTILRQAEPSTEAQAGNGYAFIALATHGRTGLRRWFLGSITEHILGATKLPLLIVRPQEAAIQVQQEATAV
jgi:nucleotide-binding universal stress UspA family protein